MRLLNTRTIGALSVQTVRFGIASKLHRLGRRRPVRYGARVDTHRLHGCDP